MNIDEVSFFDDSSLSRNPDKTKHEEHGAAWLRDDDGDSA
jgi:hypothetical protein